MWRYAFLAAAFAGLVHTTPALADADCSQLPAAVAGFVQKQDGWKLLTGNDLPSDQKDMWDKEHPDECPGLAVVSLSGTTLSYAVAILQRPAPDMLYERLVLIDGGGRVTRLAGPEQMDFPSIAYRVAPGTVYDTKSKTYIAIPHDSIVYEHVDALTKTFYLSGGKLRLLQR